MSASHQKSIMPFLRNEFLKIFEDLFTMTEFTKMTHIYVRTQNWKSKSDLKISQTKWESRVQSDSLSVHFSLDNFKLKFSSTWGLKLWFLFLRLINLRPRKKVLENFQLFIPQEWHIRILILGAYLTYFKVLPNRQSSS